MSYIGSKRSSSLVSATEITLDGAKLKSSGDSITKSDGTTAVLSESAGVVTLNNGTIGNGVVFPAGHIVQSVFNPILSTDTTVTSGDTEKVVASATGQITITSGNGVLLIVQAVFQTNPNTTSHGKCRLLEGLTTSGTELTSGQFGDRSNTFTFDTPTLVAYDSSPADTTPDYCLTLARNHSGTGSVQMNSIQQFFLFEVQQ
jgi:hypothetical protein